MLAQQSNKSHLSTTWNKDGVFAFCYKCRFSVNIESFDPETQDVPMEVLRLRETNWFEKFKIYRPIITDVLKTTYKELAEVWDITEKTIQKALDSKRLLIDERGNWYINSNCSSRLFCSTRIT